MVGWLGKGVPMSETIITVLIAIISSGLFNKLLDVFASKRSNNDSVNNALRLLLKDRLRFLCSTYIDQGWIYQDELEDLITMHSLYHNELKGNGYLDTLMSKVTNLEIRGIGVK